ncbi:VOC family protein [Glycomyces sp. MUSA5-2]|uniref:VOC family protein n=1 Tax=Glycomyces sp. MUSA5-2 TaxID=2053002 RepID=UPI00300AB5BA
MPTSIPLGAPIWADAVTPDLAGDVDFYMRLFNWAAFDSGEQFGHYTELCLGTTVSEARAVGGIAEAASGAKGSAWGVAFHAGDCVRTAAEAEKLGAQITSNPIRVGDDLVYAALKDPDGGAFGLFEPLSEKVGFTARNEPGAIVWFEYVYDGAPVEAMQFYAELLNWSLHAPDGSEPGHDAPYVGLRTREGHALTRSEEFGGARMALGPELDMTPHWTVCFGTASVDLTAAKAVDLGGAVAVAPVDDPGGRMAVLASPTGAYFTVMSPRE